jgi:hypothetical protein
MELSDDAAEKRHVDEMVQRHEEIELAWIIVRSERPWNFGTALEAVKDGKKATRAAWNGRGMYIFLGTGVAFGMPSDVDYVGIRDCLVMRAADGWLVPGWLASQTDMLADDWELVP